MVFVPSTGDETPRCTSSARRDDSAPAPPAPAAAATAASATSGDFIDLTESDDELAIAPPPPPPQTTEISSGSGGESTSSSSKATTAETSARCVSSFAHARRTSPAPPPPRRYGRITPAHTTSAYSPTPAPPFGALLTSPLATSRADDSSSGCLDLSMRSARRRMKRTASSASQDDCWSDLFYDSVFGGSSSGGGLDSSPRSSPFSSPQPPPPPPYPSLGRSPKRPTVAPLSTGPLASLAVPPLSLLNSNRQSPFASSSTPDLLDSASSSFAASPLTMPTGADTPFSGYASPFSFLQSPSLAMTSSAPSTQPSTPLSAPSGSPFTTSSARVVGGGSAWSPLSVPTPRSYSPPPPVSSVFSSPFAHLPSLSSSLFLPPPPPAHSHSRPTPPPSLSPFRCPPLLPPSVAPSSSSSRSVRGDGGELDFEQLLNLLNEDAAARLAHYSSLSAAAALSSASPLLTPAPTAAAAAFGPSVYDAGSYALPLVSSSRDASDVSAVTSQLSNPSSFSSSSSFRNRLFDPHD